MKKCILLFLAVFLVTLNVISGIKDTIQEKNFSIVPVPIVFFSPETNWAFGLAAIKQFRLKGQGLDNNSSQMYSGGAYTLKKQILLYSQFNLFWGGDQYNSNGEIGYYKYFFQFYGIGRDATEADEEIYAVRFPRIDIKLNKRWRDKHYFGPGVYFENMVIDSIGVGGILDSENITGIEGGIISGIGINYRFDSRDDIYFPTSGWNVGFLHQQFRPLWGSDYAFSNSQLDISKYFYLFNSIFALNTSAQITEGEVPMHLLSLVGGSRKIRGYLRGRYRDNQFYAGQFEWRSPNLWIFRAVLFGGVGYLGDGNWKIDWHQPIAAFGAGLRVAINKEKVNLRLDYGFNAESSGFYLTVGEAF